jgi:hypothetical protein
VARRNRRGSGGANGPTEQEITRDTAATSRGGGRRPKPPGGRKGKRGGPVTPGGKRPRAPGAAAAGRQAPPTAYGPGAGGRRGPDTRPGPSGGQRRAKAGGPLDERGDRGLAGGPRSNGSARDGDRAAPGVTADRVGARGRENGGEAFLGNESPQTPQKVPQLPRSFAAAKGSPRPSAGVGWGRSGGSARVEGGKRRPDASEGTRIPRGPRPGGRPSRPSLGSEEG